MASYISWGMLGHGDARAMTMPQACATGRVWGALSFAGGRNGAWAPCVSVVSKLYDVVSMRMDDKERVRTRGRGFIYDAPGETSAGRTRRGLCAALWLKSRARRWNSVSAMAVAYRDVCKRVLPRGCYDSGCQQGGRRGARGVRPGRICETGA
jgi:hypothetical protein